VNKIWNSARFALLNVPPSKLQDKFSPTKIKTPADKWILTELQRLIKDVSGDMDNYRFSEAGTKIYNFTWGQYCDWYLEMSKGEHMNADVLLHVLKTLLRLLHPFVPFVTEAIWEHLGEKKMLISVAWPEYDAKLVFQKEEKEIEIIRTVIVNIRSIRSEYGVEPGRQVNSVIYGGKWTKMLNMKKTVIMRLARIDDLKIEKDGKKIPNSVWKYANGIHIYLPVTGLLDVKKEIEKINCKIKEIQGRIAGIKSRLENRDFIMKAPPELVQKEKNTFSDLEKEFSNLQEKIGELYSIQK